MANRKAEGFVLLAIALIVLGTSSSAWACPWCDGGSSGINRVKLEIFNANFWMRAAAVLAPFPVFGGIVALIYFGPPRIGPRK
jgi:hypothetical protein